jgi:hypothetical protein
MIHSGDHLPLPDIHQISALAVAGRTPCLSNKRWTLIIHLFGVMSRCTVSCRRKVDFPVSRIMA